MTKLLEIKEWLKGFYGRFDVYLQAVWKFILSAGAITVLNQNLGFMEQLKSQMVVLILGLICSILPYGGMAFICAAVTLAHFYALSIELAGVALFAFLLMYLFCLRFENKAGYALILTPLLFWMKIPYLAPILVGLTGGIIGALPVGCGVAAYFVISYAKENAPSLSSSTVDNMLGTIRIIIDGLLGNKVMLLTIVAFAVTVILVHLIKSLSVDYAWLIAIGVGTVVDLLILMAGNFTMDIEVKTTGMIVGSLITILIALVIQFFLFSVDYSRTERVQFEDEEYVYYVKAVPKMRVTSTEVNVKRINAQKSQRVRNLSDRELLEEEEEDLPRGSGRQTSVAAPRSKSAMTDGRASLASRNSAASGGRTSQSTARTAPSSAARSSSARNNSAARNGEATRNIASRSTPSNITNIQDRIVQKPSTRDK